MEDTPFTEEWCKVVNLAKTEAAVINRGFASLFSHLTDNYMKQTSLISGIDRRLQILYLAASGY